MIKCQEKIETEIPEFDPEGNYQHSIMVLNKDNLKRAYEVIEKNAKMITPPEHHHRIIVHHFHFSSHGEEIRIVYWGYFGGMIK